MMLKKVHHLRHVCLELVRSSQLQLNIQDIVCPGCSFIVVCHSPMPHGECWVVSQSLDIG